MTILLYTFPFLKLIKSSVGFSTRPGAEPQHRRLDYVNCWGDDARRRPPARSPRWLCEHHVTDANDYTGDDGGKCTEEVKEAARLFYSNCNCNCLRRRAVP